MCGGRQLRPCLACGEHYREFLLRAGYGFVTVLSKLGIWDLGCCAPDAASKTHSRNLRPGWVDRFKDGKSPRGSGPAGQRRAWRAERQKPKMRRQTAGGSGGLWMERTAMGSIRREAAGTPEPGRRGGRKPSRRQNGRLPSASESLRGQRTVWLDFDRDS